MKAFMHFHKYSEFKYLVKSFSLTHNTHTTKHTVQTTTFYRKNEVPENVFSLDIPKIYTPRNPDWLSRSVFVFQNQSFTTTEPLHKLMGEQTTVPFAAQ